MFAVGANDWYYRIGSQLLMSATAMAKKPTPSGKDVDRKAGRKTAPVQIDKELARMVAVIASHDGITQADLLNDHLRPFVKAHFERVQQQITKTLRDMG